MLIAKLHMACRHSLSQQLKRALVDSIGETMGLVNSVDQVPRRCDFCCAFGKAPQLPIEGASTASSFNEKLEVDLPFLDNAITLRATGMCHQYSLSRYQSALRIPMEAEAAFRSSRIFSIFGSRGACTR